MTDARRRPSVLTGLSIVVSGGVTATAAVAIAVALGRSMGFGLVLGLSISMAWGACSDQIAACAALAARTIREIGSRSESHDE